MNVEKLCNGPTFYHKKERKNQTLVKAFFDGILNFGYDLYKEEISNWLKHKSNPYEIPKPINGSIMKSYGYSGTLRVRLQEFTEATIVQRHSRFQKSSVQIFYIENDIEYFCEIQPYTGQRLDRIDLEPNKLKGKSTLQRNNRNVTLWKLIDADQFVRSCDDFIFIMEDNEQRMLLSSKKVVILWLN